MACDADSPERLKVYLHREPGDFRLNIYGLAVLVERALGLDPFRFLIVRVQQSSLSSQGA